MGNHCISIYFNLIVIENINFFEVSTVQQTSQINQLPGVGTAASRGVPATGTSTQPSHGLTDSQMKRAYAALGLPFNQPATAAVRPTGGLNDGMLYMFTL